MATDAKDIVARYDALKEQRQTWLRDLQDIADYCLPDAQHILHEGLPSQQNQRRYDSTGMEALDILAANLQWGMTNPAIEWGRLRFRDQALNEAEGVADWLKQANDLTRASYAASNFYLAAHTFYLNYGGFGTAAMYEEEYEDYTESGVFPGLAFRTLYPSRYVVAENAQGRIDTLMRVLFLTPRQAIQAFGEDEVEDHVRTAAKMPQKCDEPQQYLHACYPRSDAKPGYPGSKNMPFASCYIDLTTKEIIRERGYEEFPYFVARWGKQHDEAPWGIGPGHRALPEMRTLDQAEEMSLEAWALHLQPPLQVLESGVVGALSQISLQSLAINVVSKLNAIQPMLPVGNMQIPELERQRYEQKIRRIFYADQLQALPEPGESNMTATEVVQRLRLMQRLMGPAFYRLSSEFLDPLADRTFGILLRKNVLPPPPLAVFLAALANQGQLDVEYLGPLARAQRADDVEAIGRVYAVGLQIAQSTQDMTIWDTLDHDKAMRRVAEVEGLPPDILVPPNLVRRQRQQRAEAQQLQQAAAELRADMESAGKFAPMVREANAQPMAPEAAA